MFPPPLAIFPQLARRRQAARNFLTRHGGLLICALFLLVGLDLAGDYGWGLDEAYQRRNAQANLNYILGQADRVATPVYLDRVFGMAFELPLLLAEQALGLTDNYSIHRLRSILTHLFFIVGGYFCYRLAYRLFGNRLIALLALLFFLLHPRLYAHSYLNTKDLPFLSMFVIALYLLERAFRRDTAGAFILLGIGVGLLTNLRIMGVMLFPAVIALRGLDWFCAAGPTERKKILLTAGLFVAAAGLTLYAVTPYAWANPVDYLLTSLTLTVNHPGVWPQLFQGEWRLSDELPPHYAAVWFGITTPPPLILLGLVGMALTAARALRRPGAVLRNTRLRFLLLLAAVFLLPPLAAVLLGSNQFDNWRHSYFVYTPFVLLAALGLGGLAAARGRRRWRAGLYGLAAAGLALILLQMTQLHPLQHDYFNFLVDRTTPEYLRTQYKMNQYSSSHQAALKYLLSRHPGETLRVRVAQRLQQPLSPAERRRLRPAGGGRPADYVLSARLSPGHPDPAFNSLYRRPYNNTFTDLRPLDAALMPPAAVAAYRELYAQALAGEPLVRADYTVYRNGLKLAFVKENCAARDRIAWFDLKIFPQRPETLPPPLRPSVSYISLGNEPVQLGAVCLAALRLPAYAAGDLMLARYNLGNYGPVGAPEWEELYSLSRPGLAELIAEYRRQRGAAAALPFILNSVEGRTEREGAGAFDVFIDRADGRNRLLYAKGDCSPDEYGAPVTLHIHPENRADLPFYLWKSGVDNRDFRLPLYGGRPGGECIAVFPLPDYPIAAIHTGQAGHWEVNLYPSTALDRLRATYAALADRQPNRRAAFDLYWQGSRLIYLRETCAAADTAANFFLHILPQDAAALPPERRDAGFANMDFAFERRGGHFDGKCLAAVALPDYPIATIRTGQHIPGQGELWAAELAGGR